MFVRCGGLIVALVMAGAHADIRIKQNISPTPPPVQKKAETARWMVHQLTYGVLGSISTRPQTKGQPFGNPYSFVDGSTANSTGILYFYASALDQSMQDFKQNAHAAFTLSEAELDYCRKQGLDPEDPPCARLTINGVFEKVQDVAEVEFAKSALFERHPNMKDYPKGHNFFVGKIVPQSLWLINIYGGATDIDVAEYFAVKPSNIAIHV